MINVGLASNQKIFVYFKSTFEQNNSATSWSCDLAWIYGNVLISQSTFNNNLGFVNGSAFENSDGL
ncbi:MAG: hypothetical protein R3B65_02265 [Candidatus Paceibacterota bacterium]